MKILLLLPGFLFCCFPGFTQNPDSLTLLAKKLTDADTQKVNLLNEAAIAYWKQGNDSLAFENHNSAIWLAKQSSFSRGEIRARLQLVRIELDYLSDLVSAKAHLDSATALAKKIGDKSLEGLGYFRRAQLYASGFPEYETQVNPLYEKAKQLFNGAGDKAREGMVYGSLGEIAGTGGHYAEAIELLLKARKLQEQTGNPEDLRATLPNLGVNYAQVGMLDEALKCFEESEKNARLRNDKRLLNFLLNQRADILIKKGKFSEALALLEPAARIHEESGATALLATTYARMGKALLGLNQLKPALTRTLLADSLYRSGIDAKEVMYHGAQVVLGNIYLANKDYAKVIGSARKGLEWAISSETPLVLEAAEYHRQLAEAFRHQGDFRQALEHLEEHKLMSDSLLNQESIQRMAVSAVTYDFEKQRQNDLSRIQDLEQSRLRQSRNILVALFIAGIGALLYVLWSNRKLREKNKLLVEKSREITEAVDKGQRIERKRVASELHDNLNTKLAAIRWQLESMQIDTFNKFNLNIHHNLVEMINDAYKDVRFISHNMMPAELERDGLAAALQHLTGKLGSKEGIVFHLLLTGQISRFDAVKEHQMYNIALELVNNVLKHAGATEVQIGLEQQGTTLTLSVSDDGTGMSPDSTSTGIGLRNLTSRTEQLGGQLFIRTPQSGGTNVTIRIPI